MEDILEITLGEGDHEPEGAQRLNTLPVEMHLCADARKGSCRFCVSVIVETLHLSFHQTFCGWEYKKETS